MNEFSYAATLTRCMAISAIALLAGVAIPAIPDAVPFLAALGPLIWYHVVFLRPRAGAGLSQAAIDSVYYYGFLITVGALGATALDLSLHGIGDDFASVAAQFGLGLLATGYAVWARVHLTASVKILDEDELREIMTQQIARSRDLLVNIELVSASFETFSTTLLQKAEHFANHVEAQTRSSIEGAAKSFESGINAICEQAQTALTELRGIVNDVTFGAEREELRRSVTSMVETVACLSHGLDQLKASSSAGAVSVGEFAGSLENVNAAAGGAADKLGRLGEDRGVVAKFSDALIVGTEHASSLSVAADVAASSITTMSDKASAAHDPVEGLGKKAVQSVSKIEKLGNALDLAGDSAEKLAALREAVSQLSGQASASGEDLGALAARINEVRDTLGNLNSSLVDSTLGLKDSMLATSEAIEGSVAASLKAAEHIVRRGAELSSSAAAATNGAERAASAI